MIAVRAKYLTALVFAATGCGGTGATDAALEPLPEGARFRAIPGMYSVWWQQVEQCAGQKQDFAKVSWYYVPGTGFFDYGSSEGLSGIWLPGRNAITIAEFALDDALIVRHEELHAILRRSDHPAQFFVEKCGDLVSH